MQATGDRANETMNESADEKFRFAVECAPNATLMINGEGRIILANEKSETMFGYSRPELLGQPADSLIQDRSQGERSEQQTHFFSLPHAQMADDRRDLYGRRKGGTAFSVEVALNRIETEQGTVVIAALFDVTDRKKAVEALNESQRMLSLVLDNIPQGVFWKDRNSKYLGCNRVVCEAVGLGTQGDLLGKSDDEFLNFTPEQAAWFLRKDREVMDSGQVEGPIIETLTRPDGSTMWLETVKVPLRDSNGHVIGILGNWHDVTAKRQAEETLRRSEQRYRSLVSAIAEIVWRADASGRIVTAGSNWVTLTGLPNDQVNSDWFKVVHPDDLPDVRGKWSIAASTATPYAAEFRLRRADGEWRHMDSRSIPIRDEDGRVLEWVGVCVDVTERKLVEERIRRLNVDLEQRVAERTDQLVAANKELEAFSYSVSHDLRAPLRAIDGFSRILQMEHAAKMPAEMQDYLRDIRANTQQMGRLVDDLLTFSRLSRQPLKKIPIEVSDVIRQCQHELRQHQDGRCVEFQLGELPVCWGDPALLKQVWINLISNALKYSSKRDVAVIQIGSRAGDVPNQRTYFIRDNGVGFDMRYVHKLFQVFQRLHRAEEYEGTGVGLAIVQRIVHRHGGRVWGESVLDGGTTFYFTLEEQGTST